MVDCLRLSNGLSAAVPDNRKSQVACGGRKTEGGSEPATNGMKAWGARRESSTKRIPAFGGRKPEGGSEPASNGIMQREITTGKCDDGLKACSQVWRVDSERAHWDSEIQSCVALYKMPACTALPGVWFSGTLGVRSIFCTWLVWWVEKVVACTALLGSRLS